MAADRTTVLVTLTGRDRPGVTSRLFSELAGHELAVADIEQVVIRGRLVLGVLLACEGDPDLTGIHRSIRTLAADLDMEAEITTGWGELPRRRGRLHVTVVGSPLLPRAVAAIARPTPRPMAMIRKASHRAIERTWRGVAPTSRAGQTLRGLPSGRLRYSATDSGRTAT